MSVVSSNYLPGDTVLVDQIVYELKSQGIFDQFRKECIADVDTKPAYQNLRQRVEGSVTGFLRKQTWNPDMNKNQVREMLRKNIYESGFLETGVERIVDQVVNPKINSIFQPKVADVVYKYLGIEKPESENKKYLKQNISSENLLPTDLEAVSPESESLEKKLDRSFDSQIMEETKVDDDESPPFEPIEEQTRYLLQEENSVDSHMSGFSGLASHDSNHSQNISSKQSEIEIFNQDSQISKHSSEGQVSMIISDDNEAKLEIGDDSHNSKSSKSLDSVSKNVDTENSEKSSSNFKNYKKDKTEEKSRSDRKSDSHKHDKHKSRHEGKSESREEKKSDKKESKDRSRDSKDSSRDRSKDNRERKDSKSNSRDKDRRSSSSKHSSSRERSSKKDSSSKDDKQKSSSKDSKRESKTDSKNHSKNSDKHRRDDKHSKSKNDKEKPEKRDSRKENKDDHFSSKGKKGDRRSTDRDSNDGNSGTGSSSASLSETSTTQQQNKSQNSNGSNSGSGSNDSGASDNVETIYQTIRTEAHITIPQIKLIKPKFACNINEARKLMKIRRHLHKLEKEGQLELAYMHKEILENNLTNTKSIESNEKTTNVIEEASSTLPNSVSAASWDAIEAKLNSGIDYDSYGDYSETTSEAENEDQCLFFVDDILPETRRYKAFVKTLIDKYDLGLNKLNRNGSRNTINTCSNNGSRGMKRKLFEDDHDVHNNNRKLSNHLIEAHDQSFPLPLSPAESDKSLDKKMYSVEISDKQRKSNNKAKTAQRYSSDDLYKPRLFNGSRRRTARTTAVD